MYDIKQNNFLLLLLPGKVYTDEYFQKNLYGNENGLLIFNQYDYQELMFSSEGASSYRVNENFDIRPKI